MKLLRNTTVLIILLLSQINVNGQWRQFEAVTGSETYAGQLLQFKNILFLTSFAGTAISTDKGLTWRPGPDFLGAGFRLVIHKDVLYALDIGLNYSTSNGIDWQKNTGVIGNEFVQDLDSDGTTAYASTLTGVFVSTDDLKTWVRFQVNPPIYSVRHTVVRPNTKVMYSSGSDELVTFEGQSGYIRKLPAKGEIIALEFQGPILFVLIAGKGLYKSSDVGFSWQQVKAYSSSDQGRVCINPDKIFLTVGGQLLRSDNSGDTWVDLGATPHSAASTHFTTDDDYLYMSAKGNMYRKPLQGNGDWQEISNRLFLLDFYDIETAGSTIFAGTSVALKLSFDNGVTWSETGDPAERQAHSIAVSGSTVYTASNNISRSDNQGINWQTLPLIDGIPAALVEAIGDTIYAGMVNRTILKSIDRGASWTKIGQTLSIYPWSIKVFEDNSLYTLLSNRAGLWRYDRKQNNWFKITNASQDQQLSDFVKIGNTVIAAVGGSLLKTDNDGQSWTTLSVVTGTTFRSRHNQLYLSARGRTEGDYEFLQSVDSGRTWISIKENLPNGNVQAMSFSDKYVLAGVEGRGLWYRDITEVSPPRLTISMQLPDSSLSVGQPISIRSDQELFVNGQAITLETVSDIVSVRNKSGSLVPFTVELHTNDSGFDIHVDHPEIDEKYTVIVSAIANKSGLRTSTEMYKIVFVDNTPPGALDLTQSTNENISFQYNLIDFSNAYTDHEGLPLKGIQIVTLPEHGRLTLDDLIPLVAGNLTENQIAKLRYTPNSDFAGTDSWAFRTFDGLRYSENSARAIVEVIPDSPPVVDDFSIVVPQNSTFVMNASLFIKRKGADLTKVKFVQLPAHGTLARASESVLLGQEFSLSEFNEVGYSPNTNYIGNDTVWITAFDGYNFSPPVRVSVLVTPVAGVEEDPDNRLEIYPNPANNIITIKAIGLLANVRTIEVYNAIGQASLFLTNYNEDEISLDVSNLPNGMYVIKIDFDKVSIIRKVYKY